MQGNERGMAGQRNYASFTALPPEMTELAGGGEPGALRRRLGDGNLLKSCCCEYFEQS